MKFTLTQPQATYLTALKHVSGGIVSSTAVEEMDSEEFRANPVGTGPFRFVEWTNGERVLLEANAD